MDPPSPMMENTILSTPKPISTSTVQRERKRHKDLDEVPQRLLAESSDSLGILSIPNLDDSQVSNSSNFAELELEHQRILANDVLRRAHNRGASIPSRLLRPSEHLATTTTINKIQDESTINESDLEAPSHRSTPRSSGLGMSLGQSLAGMSLSLQKTDMSLHKFMEDFQSNFQNCSSFFQPASESKLLADEVSWRRQNDIPVERKDISLMSAEGASKMSMGSFFKMRSDDVSDLGIKSPEKCCEPVPLIESEVSLMSQESGIPRQSSDTLSLSTIQRILSDTRNTPNKAIEMMMQIKSGEISTRRLDNSTFDNSRHSSEFTTETETRAMSFISVDSSNKENVNCTNSQRGISPDLDKSARSTQSASSLSSLPDNKLPIESSQRELVWSCVKLGKSVSQEVVVRNKSSHRLRVQCKVDVLAFKLKERNESDCHSLILNFHPRETRVLNVTFAPMMAGAAAGEIIFTPVDVNHKQTKRQVVRLFGYGGDARVTVRNLPQQKFNGFFLNLNGNTDNNCQQKATFVLCNSGTLPGFAYFIFDPKLFGAFSSIKIEPMRVVLPAKDQTQITVTYTPKKDDLKYLNVNNVNSSILEVGVIKMISGSEVNRGRIRRLCRKAVEKSLEVSPLCNNLKERFEGECMPTDLKYLLEHVEAMKDLMQFLNHAEISVTLQQDLDQSSAPSAFTDETLMFHTLSEDFSRCGLSETVACKLERCKVEPSMVLLYPPRKTQDRLLIRSLSDDVLYFEATSSPAGLDLVPNVGELRPGSSKFINISLSGSSSKEPVVFKISIYFDNEVLNVDVKSFPF